MQGPKGDAGAQGPPGLGVTPGNLVAPAYDSGWVDITAKAGQYVVLTHNLNTTNTYVEILGSKSGPQGGAAHQQFLGLTAYTYGWSKTFGGTAADYGFSEVQTADGGFVVAGITYLSGSGWDFYIVKTDSTGNLQWNSTFGGAGTDYGYSVVQTADGGFAIAGYTNSFGPNYDVYLVKTDSAGNMQWNKTYGTRVDNRANAVIQTADGGFAIAGYTNSSGSNYDVYLVKTDSAGNLQWRKTYGGTGDDYGSALVQTADEGFAVVGSTYSYGSGGDVYLVKTDSAGDMLWNRTFGGSGTDYGYSVIQTADGGFVVAGSTHSSSSGWDVYLVKSDSQLGLAWVDTTPTTITIYRGATDPYWDFVRVIIWRFG